ncbi:Anthranilate synthase component 2 [Polystyrenella longa]|uniref:Anthranilate synthase component 2 n=1 Tax=Polystyrenella longa TaxID=2528007 RepID=A0A518CLU0_9PLAN|nr:aminodeoxychorismate/anthranilate synthase component II [Polystyrenella longa]QDU80211.1 Anthranilate synthase component 2 [Polystyrenella longa]
MIVLIDNYDSFVFNLARYCQELGCDTHVVRSDEIDANGIRKMDPQAIILSPGPCTPREAGNCLSIVETLLEEYPILGVCLGHQVIAAATGSEIIHAPEPIHGRTSRVEHVGSALFENVPNPFQATRYHSLIIDEASLGEEFQITARSDDGVPMAIEHHRLPVMGVQFHPESILTDHGHRLIHNFFSVAGLKTPDYESRELPHPNEKYSTTPLTPVHTPGPVPLR